MAGCSFFLLNRKSSPRNDSTLFLISTSESEQEKIAILPFKLPSPIRTPNTYGCIENFFSSYSIGRHTGISYLNGCFSPFFILTFFLIPVLIISFSVLHLENGVLP